MNGRTAVIAGISSLDWLRGSHCVGDADRPYDALIAGQALRSGATLVTADVSEFARVEGLAWQDWTAEA
jgi:predicted nucleic acid-binding protein